MAVTISMASISADVSVRVGRDDLRHFFDSQGFKTRSIIHDHDHLMLVELYLGGLKVQKLMMETGRAEAILWFGQH